MSSVQTFLGINWKENNSHTHTLKARERRKSSLGGDIASTINLLT